METFKLFVPANDRSEGSRWAKEWKEQEFTWAQFADKCSCPMRTKETMEAFLGMSREEQTRVKDVGGFVAGTFKGTRRGARDLEARTMITLDLDNAAGKQMSPDEIWSVFQGHYPVCSLCYSTHKHTPEAPRLRFIIPTDRPMAPDEHEAVSRRIAEAVGMDLFDTASFSGAQLMFWPSTPSDGEFYYKTESGKPLLGVDTVLATYDKWSDTSEWPRNAKEGFSERPHRGEAEDPTEKSGIIGAFCRAYSIEEAIEAFLIGVYDPVDGASNRYTYKEGSTSGGLVCYDSKWAYSHHDTDPCSHQLCNAFDLVRIHKFGSLDQGQTTSDPARLKSYKEMTDLAEHDEATRRELIRGAGADFEGIDDDQESPWSGLEVDAKSGKAKSTINNYKIILRNDEKLKGAFWEDELTGYPYCVGLPWGKPTSEVHKWEDRDDSGLRAYIETNYGICAKDKINDAFNVVLGENARHPIRDYLNGLPEWDGTHRLDRLIIDYLGAEDTELTKAMTRKHFAAAVARVMSPGCQYDYCLTLTGPEGVGKSSLLNVMGGDWFNDSVFTMEGKDGMDQLRASWIIELAELAGVKRSEVESVKAFISKRADSYRAAYDRRVTVRKRQCVFCGTTNEAKFLKGDTGNRRFWVIQIKPELAKEGSLGDRLERLKADRDQIWAEALHFYKRGETLYLEPELEAEARQVQEAFSDIDPDGLLPELENYLNRLYPTDWDLMPTAKRREYLNDPDGLEAAARVPLERFCAKGFLMEKIRMEPRDTRWGRKTREVNSLMRLKFKDDWEEVKPTSFPPYGSQRGYKRKQPPVVEEDL